jgi:hypothetical protein
MNNFFINQVLIYIFKSDRDMTKNASKVKANKINISAKIKYKSKMKAQSTIN